MSPPCLLEDVLWPGKYVLALEKVEKLEYFLEILLPICKYTNIEKVLLTNNVHTIILHDFPVQ